MPFRLNAAQLFLTYPQCPLAKDKALEHLEEILRPYVILKYIIAHELHANGDDHLHCYFKLEKKVNFTSAQCLDIGIYHGNYQGCRSSINVARYCTKKEDYISNYDVAEETEKRVGKKKILGSELLGKRKTLEELTVEHPELLFGYKKLKEDLAEFLRDQEDQRKSLPTFIPNPWGRVICSKLLAKKRHYWIFSRQPDKGKTFYFAKPLNEQYRCYLKKGDFTYWNFRGDEECIILDEYNSAKLSYDTLNSIADGDHEFRIFQGGVRRLRRPLIIILSNQCISDLYPHMNPLLYARFIEIELL